jgi:hypothetical protein
MDIGLLWFDNNPSTDIEEKVRRAAGHYRRKFGRPANLVFANSATLAEQPGHAAPFEVEQDGVALKVVAAGHMLPHHFWVGVAAERDDQTQQNRAATG